MTVFGVHAGLQNAGGFPADAAKYLGRKYGYRPGTAAANGARVTLTCAGKRPPNGSLVE